MATIHGSKTDVYGNGYVLSPFLNVASIAGTRDQAETTTFGKVSKTHIPGLKDTTMALDGIYDGVANAIDDIFYQAFAAGKGFFSYMPQGDGFGNRVFTIDAVDTSHSVDSSLSAAVMIKASLVASDEGVLDRGLVAQAMTTQGAPGNGSSINNTAATTNGGALVVHATAATTLSVWVQDSADNATFADIAAANITIAAGRSSQRDIFTGTIRQYTRIRWTGTGTFQASISRF